MKHMWRTSWRRLGRWGGAARGRTPWTRLGALGFALVCASVPAWAMSDMLMQGMEPGRKSNLRDAIEAHRAVPPAPAVQGEAGRRLSPAERTQLREQLRSQWVRRSDGVHSVSDQRGPQVGQEK